MALLKQKWVLSAIAVLVLLCVWGIKSVFFSQDQAQYLTAVAKRGDLEVSALATGIIKPYSLVAVGARATGRILSLQAKPGTKVKRGDLLAEIDATTQENDLKSKRAALKSSCAQLADQEAQLFLAQQNLERAEQLLKSSAVSRANFDSTNAQLRMQQAQIDILKARITQAEVDVESAEVNLGYTRVTAPSDGTVLATVVQEGQTVNAVQSAPTIAILGDLSKMTVRAEISEADIVNVKAGQGVYFNVIGNRGRRYDSKLEMIEPAPESIRSDISLNPSTTATSSLSSSAIYYNGLFDVDNSDEELRTYMTAEVHIVLGQVHNAILLPVDALDSTNGPKAHVMVVHGQALEKREVEIGLNNKSMVEIKSGIQEGERVVTGSDDGTPIPSMPHPPVKGV